MKSKNSLVAACAVALAVTGALRSHRAPQARPCPPGYSPLGEIEPDRSAGLEAACILDKHPEPPFEWLLRQKELLEIRSAPFDSVPPAAFAAAVAERRNLEKHKPKLKGIEGTWRPYGSGPLISDSPAYSSVNGLGLANVMGRIDSLSYDPEHGHLFAATGTGGVWLSEDAGDHWRSIGDALPSQIVGAVAWSPANGGTVLAVSGDPSFGGVSGYTGFGAFYSTDLGQTWQKSAGVPDGALGFAMQVDPSNPAVVYAGTLFGLFRSVDAGRTFTNVALPTGACAGVEGGTTGRPECHLANVVTDVVIRASGGVSDGINADVPAGTVLAAVGWRGGNKRNPDGTIQSPGNGLYRSSSGAPGSFVKLSVPGFAPQDRIGRVELGAATGAAQDHDYVYAIVQDAVALDGGFEMVDATRVEDPRPIGPTLPLLGAKLGQSGGTNLNGIYVSADFGASWTLMADDNQISKDPATGSALVGLGQAIGFEPGIQSWYNEWILPDPTQQTPNGIPTRLAFGLEEVWQNEASGQPMNGPTAFKVIGRYFSGQACLLLTLGLPECPTNRPPTTSTTTHPDHHDAVWIADGAGGVTLAVGSDGGFYKQHAAAGAELGNGGWGRGNQDGFNTLLPYDVAMANDGTVWAGLQDNGHMKITPAGLRFQTFGGDGTYAEVDPADSNVAYEATPGGSMRVTTDGGRSWRGIAPPVTNARFVNPFEMDPTDANHLVTGGNEIVETVAGPNTGDGGSGNQWTQVFDLGTSQHPGAAWAVPSAGDPANGMTALGVRGDAVYAGFCAACSILNSSAPFRSGIATNVGGTLPPRRTSPDGWHVATAAGLPNRFVTSIAIDPVDPRTVYVTLGGYSNKWVPPGTLQDDNRNVGVGHVFRSSDAGETFQDVSGNLPDVSASWVTLRGGRQLIVGTDVGVFATDVKGGSIYAPLVGMPIVPITTMQLKPDNPNLLVAAAYGRGIWTFEFDRPLPGTGGSGGIPPFETPPNPLGIPLAGPFGFELDAQGWTVATNSASPTMVWRRSLPGHNSATSFQVFPYTDESTTTLTSPLLSHPGGWAFVDFRNRRNTEPGFDYMFVEWSSDATNWNTALWVRSEGAWRDDLTFDAKNAGYPAFDLEQVAFTAPAGPLRIRFRFTSDELVSAPLYEGVYVDDVVIKR